MQGQPRDHGSDQSGRRWRDRQRRLMVLPACLAVLFCCSATYPVPSSVIKTNQLPDHFITAPVLCGTLRNILAEQGLVNSAENIVVASECEWPERILRLVPEGEWVEEGDVVVELDSSVLEERLQEREIRIINALAELADARKALWLQTLENESDAAQSELAKRLADLDLDKYLQGEFPKQQKEGAAAVALAEEDLARAGKRREYAVRMARKGYESPMEVEKQRLALLKYEHALGNAQRELHVLVEYDYPRQVTELESAAVETKRELSRVQQQAELALFNRQILVKNRRTQYQQQLDYADRLQRSITACTIRSPKTGEIIYANEGRIRNEIIEGAMVRHRQEVVRIPNLDDLQVNVRIHESQITGVAAGLDATISVDAFPGLVYRGHVTSVSALPTAGSYYSQDLKEYDAAIRIDATPKEMAVLKPGLTAQVDIQISQQDDCLSVPPQSIVNVAGRKMVFISTDDGVEHREVEIGMITDTGVEVVSGLQKGEQVLLSPRTICGEQIVALTDYYASEIRAENIGG